MLAKNVKYLLLCSLAEYTGLRITKSVCDVKPAYHQNRARIDQLAPNILQFFLAVGIRALEAPSSLLSSAKTFCLSEDDKWHLEPNFPALVGLPAHLSRKING